MLSNVLDAFQEKYSGVTVDPTPIDITDCFLDDKGIYDGPRSYGKMPDNKVFAYAAFGAPLLTKYGVSGQSLKSVHGRAEYVNLGDDFKVISCLCQKGMKNTSFHEIKDAMSGTNTIQGYKKHHIEAIEKKLIQAYPLFSPDQDTAFIFAGEESSIKNQIALNSMWLDQIVKKGSKTLDYMTRKEVKLMKKVFPKSVLKGKTIEENSYMFGRPLHTKESVDFLKTKVQSYKTYKKAILADTISMVTYSIGVGIALDAAIGLKGLEILTARASGVVNNSLTGGPYGLWRDGIYKAMKVVEDSGRLKRFAAEMLSFNSFQVPIYGAILGAIGWMSKGELNTSNALNGAGFLALLSPIISPTTGWWMDSVRKIFGVKVATGRATE